MGSNFRNLVLAAFLVDAWPLVIAATALVDARTLILAATRVDSWILILASELTSKEQERTRREQARSNRWWI